MVGKEAEISLFVLLLESIDLKEAGKAEKNIKSQFFMQELIEFAC